MEPAFIIPLFIIFAIVWRLVAGSFDKERVEEYIRDRGGKLIDKSWDPFGPGWWGENNSRIYEIVYSDRVGDVHKAHVKTSMNTGVYLTNDRIVDHAKKDDVTESIESGGGQMKENLHQEVERLRNRVRELEAKK